MPIAPRSTIVWAAWSWLQVALVGLGVLREQEHRPGRVEEPRAAGEPSVEVDAVHLVEMGDRCDGRVVVVRERLQRVDRLPEVRVSVGVDVGRQMARDGVDDYEPVVRRSRR